MAKKISELDAVLLNDIDDNDVLVINDGGETKKVSIADLKAHINKPQTFTWKRIDIDTLVNSSDPNDFKQSLINQDVTDDGIIGTIVNPSGVVIINGVSLSFGHLVYGFFFEDLGGGDFGESLNMNAGALGIFRYNFVKNGDDYSHFFHAFYNDDSTVYEITVDALNALTKTTKNL